MFRWNRSSGTVWKLSKAELKTDRLILTAKTLSVDCFCFNGLFLLRWTVCQFPQQSVSTVAVVCILFTTNIYLEEKSKEKQLEVNINCNLSRKWWRARGRKGNIGLINGTGVGRGGVVQGLWGWSGRDDSSCQLCYWYPSVSGIPPIKSDWCATLS